MDLLTRVNAKLPLISTHKNILANDGENVNLILRTINLWIKLLPKNWGKEENERNNDR